MNDLRTAAQQALEALEVATTPLTKDRQEVLRAQATLRAALAQQAEPVEPVAKVELMMTGGNAGLATRIVEIDHHLRDRLRPGQLLYTAPPQRKPLTEEEIDVVIKKAREDAKAGWPYGPNYVLLAIRGVEAAHGIKE